MKNTAINEIEEDCEPIIMHKPLLKDKKATTKFDSLGEVLTFENGIMHAGGFGIFQWIAMINFMLLFISNQLIFQCLPFLTLFPKYICPKKNPNCTYIDHCQNPNLYPID
jgi:hypothetical protein